MDDIPAIGRRRQQWIAEEQSTGRSKESFIFWHGSGCFGPDKPTKVDKLKSNEEIQHPGELTFIPTELLLIDSQISRQDSSSGSFASPRPSSIANVFDLTGPPRSHPRRATTGSTRERRNRNVILPQWQADAEVSSCPICETKFSFWYRKHHCR